MPPGSLFFPWQSNMSNNSKEIALFNVLLVLTVYGILGDIAYRENSLLVAFVMKKFDPALLLAGLLACALNLAMLLFFTLVVSPPYHYFPYNSKIRLLNDLIGVFFICGVPPYLAHFYCGHWPFLQKLAWMMLTGVVSLKFISLIMANRELEAEVLTNGIGRGMGLYVNSALKAEVPLSGVTFGGREWILDTVPWPQNLKTKELLLFLFSPSLSFCPNVPRFKSISVVDLMERAVLFITFAGIGVTLHEGFLSPIWEKTTTSTTFYSYLELFSGAAVPCTLVCCILYFLVFECVCNFFAELTYQADRQFSGEWFAVTSYEEFSRQWNFPVGDALHSHVYTPFTRLTGGKMSSMVATYLVSIGIHELFVWGAMGRNFKWPWLTIFSLMQIPLLPLMCVITSLHPRP